MTDIQIVEAFSRISVPEDVLRNSNISQLVAEMRMAKMTVDSSEAKLSALRQQKKESNFISNIWNDQDDKIEDAQFALNSNVRWLSSLSSKLLILNTAMAKIMNGQQGVLQNQQVELKSQARGIEEQNAQIKAQQEILERNQREFNQAVEALARATLLTHTQAADLMRCVEKVNASEQRMAESHARLSGTIDERLRAIADGWSETMATRQARFDDAHQALDKRVEERLAASDASVLARFKATEAKDLELDKKIESITAREARMFEELEKVRKEMRMYRIAHMLGGVAIAALFLWMAIGRSAMSH